MPHNIQCRYVVVFSRIHSSCCQWAVTSSLRVVNGRSPTATTRKWACKTGLFKALPLICCRPFLCIFFILNCPSPSTCSLAAAPREPSTPPALRPTPQQMTYTPHSAALAPFRFHPLQTAKLPYFGASYTVCSGQLAPTDPSPRSGHAWMRRERSLVPRPEATSGCNAL